MGTGKDTREMGKDDNSKTRVKRLRWFALGCLAGVALLWALYARWQRTLGYGSG
jgi:hypothetical protein